MPESPCSTAAERSFRQAVLRDLPRNYAAHLVHGLLGQTGFRLVNAPTFVPAYLFALSGSELVVGLARAGQAFGQCLTPLLSASLIDHRPRVLGVGLWLGGLMRLQILGIAAAGFWLADEPAVVATLVLLCLFGALQGMQGVVFPFLMSKVIPVERRGVLTGARSALAGLTAASAGLVGGWLIQHDALGNGYAATFLLGFALTALGLSAMFFVREPGSPRVRARATLRSRLGELPALLRGDRDFTAYFLARALATLGRMAVPYYVLFARSKVGVSGQELGVLTTVFLLAETTTTLAWGALGDRLGFKAVFVASIVIWALAVLGLTRVEDHAELRLAFVAIGTGMGGFMLGSRNLLLEFGSRHHLPIRIGVANTASEAVGAIGPLAGGLILLWFSYETVFAIAVAVKLAAAVGALALVREPRRAAS